MTHIFVINPAAGKNNDLTRLSTEIRQTAKQLEAQCEVYFTQEPEDATRFVRQRCSAQQRGESLRFYACGGDGTLHEVVNGVMRGSQAPTGVSVGMVPIGSGNDFARCWLPRQGAQGLEPFLRLENQFLGSQQSMDLIRCVGGSYAVNMVNIGFDAKVAQNSQHFRGIWGVDGSLAYLLSAFFCLLGRVWSPMQLRGLTETGKEFRLEGGFLLAAVGNGCCCGGGFCCTPLARPDDGRLDLCAVRKISRWRLPLLVQRYRLGLHVTDPRLAPWLEYHHLRRLTVESPVPLCIGVDGEIFLQNSVVLEVLPGALPFCVPAGLPVHAAAPAAN